MAAAPATADVLVDASASANVRHDLTQRSGPDLESSRVDVRPALVLMLEKPRLVWRAGYLFSGSLTFRGDGGRSYSNALSLSAAAQLSDRGTLTFSAGVTQGDTEFRMSQQPADAGEPVLRAPESPALVTATAAQAFAWETTARYRLGQELEASRTSPQAELDRANAVVSGTARLDRLFPRDALGVLTNPRWAKLGPLVGDLRPPVETVANSVLGSWNHDFDPRWNGQVTAGVEQVNTLGSAGVPARTHPAGSLTVRYLAGDSEWSLSALHGAIANVESGTMTLSDQAVVRGLLNVDGPTRQIVGSAGFVRSEPLGGEAPPVYAVQGDLGVTWELWEQALFSARYSLAYQWGSGPLVESFIHVALVGITARWGNAPYIPPVPTLGAGRVDGGDAVSFPGAEGERETPPPAP